MRRKTITVEVKERKAFPKRLVRRALCTHSKLVFPFQNIPPSSSADGDTALENMSLKPAHIAQNPYLYPVGNTPAVCLTDTLPPEADARVLLLGCGDIRNILCTAYNDAGSGTWAGGLLWLSGKETDSSLDNRAIDFTCCDIEAEIIARNVVALTHIICDKEDAHNQHVWNIYYHVFIDPATMATLQAHVKDLLDAARSFDEWHRSKYSTFIRFCDEGTFTAVVRLWKLYATQLSSDPAFTNLQNLLKDQWKAAQRHQHNRVGHGVVLEGLRAAAPVLESHTDTIKIYRTFWSTGTCLDDKKVTSKFTIANPMFGCFRGGLLLHYGQSPLSGFHLAPVYTPMTDASPLTTKTAKEFWPTGSRPLHTAFEQFNAWCNALRKRASSLTVRFANADAIAFCHTLQHFQAFGGVDEAFWYRNPWSFERFILSKTDYSTQGSAPASFNIIDTSNLMDHLGSLNVLAAAASLLERGSPSTLRTEMMLPREANVAGSAEKLLCGNLPSVALLLGLKPIQYWTNATATWHLNEALLPDTPDDAQILNSMSRPIIMWKPADLSCVRYSATELARFLYGIYLEMHADESFAAKFSLLGLMKGDLLRKKLTEYDLYTRGSLTALLQCIKKSNTVDWQHFSRELIANLILNDRDLNMGPHHFQSLCAQLDSFGLIQMDQVFDWWHPRTFFDYLQGPFKAWKDIPPIVCITLVVPRNVVDMFSHIDKGNGTPLCQMEVQSSISQKQATYADIQMGFGQLHASGTAFTNQYNVKVNPDIEGWKSKSPLIVSTMVSTCSLVEYGDTAARIVFALKGSSSNAAAFTSRLGIFLHLHQSMVGAKDVFISRYRPNMSGHISVGSTTFPRTSQGR